MSSNTINEILRQPGSWRKILSVAEENIGPLAGFLADFMGEDGQILLAGAGSSEYIGKMLCPHLSRFGRYGVRSCGTTDLVVFPESCLSPRKNTLLVSFARSGDSPESLGAVRAAEAVSSQLRQLILTCNKQGKLAALGAESGSYYVINLPDETNDRGFAMTNSVTSMYLMALLCLLPERFAAYKSAVADIAEAAERFLADGTNPVTDWAGGFDFSRIVYLGTDALKGAAQESSLKMLELTGGRTAVLFDSPLGFRHGPKSFVNDETLVVFYLSDDAFARKYELDLLREISQERRGNKILVISGQPCAEAGELADCDYSFDNKHSYDNGLLVPEFLLVAQMLAYNKSVALQIDPDNPSPTGIINRVVKGVTVYPCDK